MTKAVFYGKVKGFQKKFLKEVRGYYLNLQNKMISISIKSNSMVILSEPTPSGILQLFKIDQAAQWTHAPVIHIYKPNNNIPSSFEKTKNSLSHALIHFYPLASQLRWKEGN